LTDLESVYIGDGQIKKRYNDVGSKRGSNADQLPRRLCVPERVVILRCGLVEITSNKQSILRLMKNVHLVTFLVTFKISIATAYSLKLQELKSWSVHAMGRCLAFARGHPRLLLMFHR
jgi:hypothetical protein